MTQFRRVAVAFAMTVAAAVPASSAHAAELVGSLRSMRHQHEVAREESYAFLATASQIRQMVAAGELVPVESNADLLIDGQVPHRFARPEVRTFLERLGAQYRAATGRRLVVTSLVRASAEQPPNAHRLSVHPAGMALDLRIPAIAKDRRWLERTLLALEADGVLDVTRERRPPHYHVAVFPAEYRAHVAAQAPQVPAAAPVTTPASAPAMPALAALAGDTVQPVDVTDAVPGTRVPLQAAAFGLVLGLGLFGRAERRRRRRA